ncbi:hypothetical protein N7508_009791 [Penicillium antarcticum]|uniref:uncharacterized protein n=1 Tax=Penicillium antarcticum TaxID=416450 RepID=UPI0023A50B0A|nr:uncharacterized protein N7508_009791 [Penicillium antarcticum]KAJ5294970.1 hypothetical protein N7508_009791 [Penicillium antarcticum]
MPVAKGVQTSLYLSDFSNLDINRALVALFGRKLKTIPAFNRMRGEQLPLVKLPYSSDDITEAMNTEKHAAM